MDGLEKLQNAKTIEQRTDLAIEELYKLIENIDVMDKGIIKRILFFIIAILQGVFRWIKPEFDEQNWGDA